MAETEDPGAPRWLNAHEHTAWLALAAMIVRLPQELDRQLRSDSGMNHFDYMVLVMLSEAPGRSLRMSTLATLTDGKLPRLSQVVDKLERRGWVERAPDPSDGRYTIASMTDAGWDTIVAAAPGHVEVVRRLVFDALTPQQVAGLATACERILAAIDPDHPATCPSGSSRKA